MRHEDLSDKSSSWERKERKFLERRCRIDGEKRCKYFPGCKPCWDWV